MSDSQLLESISREGKTMKLLKVYAAILAAWFVLTCFHSEASAQPMSGNVNAYGWTFTWAVDSTSGVKVRDVWRNGVRYMHNGSLPVIRVQYDAMCGPFIDRIKWDNIQPDGAGNKVRVTENSEWLTVWVQAKISSYWLTQAWWFHKTMGLLVPEFGSSGLQCEFNHRHHPLWRFDFDVGSSSNNRVQTYNAGVYSWQFTEFNTTKAAVGNDVIIFPDSDWSIFANLHPNPNDGTTDSFANWDYAGRRYPSFQNDPWAPWEGLYADQGDLESASHPNTSNNGESIDIQDIVFWYSAHLAHAMSAGGSQWSYVGPNVWLQDW
jgi:hypothetical protein